MPEDVGGDILDVLRTDVVATRQPRSRARGPVDAHAGPRTGAVHDLSLERRVDAPGITGSDDDIDDVLL